MTGTTAGETVLDLRGLRCPQPVLRAKKALRSVPVGATLVLECTDPLTVIDVPHFVNQTGHLLGGREQRWDPATEECCRLPESLGHRVVRVPAAADGRVDPGAVMAACAGDTALVTTIHAQNETGILQPVGEIAGAMRGRGTLVHVDAARSVGEVAVDVTILAAAQLAEAGRLAGGDR
jgi:tRNA 2-thiouridine synthesizing protein A